MKDSVRVSVAIIRTDGREPNYILEEKTPGYPAERLVGSICLIGGMAESGHRNFRYTMETELREELKPRPDLAEEFIKRLNFYRGFEVLAPRDYLPRRLKPKEGDLRVLTAVFESIVPEDLAIELGISRGSVLSEEEGKIQVYSESDLRNLGFMSGYDHVLEGYLSEIGRPIKLRTHVPGYVVIERNLDPEKPFTSYVE